MERRRNEAIKLRESGLTYAEIGHRLGITRERVRQILSKLIPHKHDLESKVMLTAGEAAHLLGIHVNTVRRWSEKGTLRAYRICSRGDRRFLREDIDRFLKERQMGG